MILQLQNYEPQNCRIGKVWANIKGYEGSYQICNDGTVRSLPRYTKGAKGCKILIKGQIKEPVVDGAHLRIELSKNNITKKYRVHRLVAQHFVPNPDKHDCVIHLDKNTMNNKESNLKWVSHYTTGYLPTRSMGENSHTAKLTESLVKDCINRYKKGDTIKKMAKELGVSECTLNFAVFGKTWKHLSIYQIKPKKKGN